MGYYYRYFIYLTQEELDAEIPSETGKIYATSRQEAEDKLYEEYPDAYYLFCMI